MNNFDRESPPLEFALELLRRHPQISYQHAVSAGEYAGIQNLSKSVFRRALDRLGLTRDDPDLEGPDDAPPASRALQHLESIRAQFAETEDFRAALLQIRAAVRAALDEDAAGDQV